jgi:hypothetical protein
MLNGNEIIKEVRLRRAVFSAIANSQDNHILKKMILRGYPNKQPIPDGGIEYSAERIREMLNKAQMVFWDSNLMFAAESGYSIFKGTTIPGFNPPTQLWINSFQPPLCMDIDGWGKCSSAATLISLERNGNLAYCLRFVIPYYFDLDWKEKIFPIGLETPSPMIVIGSCYYSNEKITNSFVLQIISGIHFLAQPFVENTTLDHVASFDGAHRQSKLNDAKKIQIVYLRRREQHPTLQDGTSNPVDWSCQWLVQGHWRNQYHPSDQSHKPAFIQSYVKGPEDKPFRVPREKIFAAVR